MRYDDNYYERNNLLARLQSELPDQITTSRGSFNNRILVKLVERAKQGDSAASTLLISNRKTFLQTTAVEFCGNDLSRMDDLMQEGSKALLQAIQNFDPTRGEFFLPYVNEYIRLAMRKYARESFPLIHIPGETQDRRRKLKKATQDLEIELQRTPSTTELAIRTGLTEPVIEQLADLEILDDVVSLDSSSSDDDNQGSDYWMDLLAANDRSRPDVIAEQHELRQSIALLLSSCLLASEKEILDLYYGLGNRRPHTYAEIGHLRGISKQRVQQIALRAIKKLRNSVAKVKLDSIKILL